MLRLGGDKRDDFQAHLGSFACYLLLHEVHPTAADGP